MIQIESFSRSKVIHFLLSLLLFTWSSSSFIHISSKSLAKLHVLVSSVLDEFIIFLIVVQHHTQKEIVGVEKNDPAVKQHNVVHQHVYRYLVHGLPRLHVHHQEPVPGGGRLDDDLVEGAGGQNSVVIWEEF